MTYANQTEAESSTILVVDDEPHVCAACQRFLTRLGHYVDIADSVEQAQERLAAREYDVVVTDLQLPGSSGLDLLAHLRGRYPATRAILMSGRAKTADAAVAIQHGVDAMLLKPFDLDDLRAGVEKALAAMRARQTAAKDRELYEAMLRQRETTSRIWILRAAHALAAAVEAKDPYTAGHASRVTAYSARLAETISGVDLASFRLGAQLHDVGKIGIPDHLLNKVGPLSSEELALVWEHPATGAGILEPLIDDPSVIGMVRWHHERWDGNGYPDKLSGKRIPLPARILAIGDALDAMTSARSYRPGLPWKFAIDEIRACAGTHFDPGIVARFESCLPALESLYESFEASRLPPTFPKAM